MQSERPELPYADELGPAKIIHVHEPSCGLHATLVIDNVARGPAIGGLRMAPDVTLSECARLARAMTLKNAAAGLPHGGGKSVLVGDPRMESARKEHLIRAFAHALRNETDYIFGPDMGTNEACMAWIKDEIGRAVGLPEEAGGIPLDDLGATGWGLAACAEVAAPACGISLVGARIAIQGYGAVGRHAANFLARLGTRLVAASDTSGTIVNPAGIDVNGLGTHKLQGGRIADYAGGEILGPDAVIDVPCDIWIPAARPDVIREDNVARLQAKLVLQGANIPFTAAAEHAAAGLGITVVPDFIANAGGVICAAMEYSGAAREAAFAAIAEKVRANTRAVLAAAGAHSVLPREAALVLAASRVRKAMGWRRFGAL